MKAIALTTLLTLCIAAKASDYVDYSLKCAQEEVGIRWPSYFSNSDYYVCQSLGGRQLKMSCNAGEVFTFVLQMCTTPSKFIPPPPLDILPTSAAAIAEPLPIIPGLNFPMPLHPGSGGPQTVPIIIDGQPPIIEDPIIRPPYVESPLTQPQEKPFPEPEIPEQKPNKPFLPSLPGLKPPTKPASPIVPIPPTPAPTPPVVKPPSPPSPPNAPKPNSLKLPKPSVPKAPTPNNRKPTVPVPNGKKPAPKPAAARKPPAPPRK